MSNDRDSESRFVFVACLPAATRYCRQEIAALRDDWLPAWSRPGLLTYKVPGTLAERFELPATFARSFGYSLQTLKINELSELTDAIGRHLEKAPVNAIHVWDRCWSDEPTADKRAADTPAARESGSAAVVAEVRDLLIAAHPGLITACQMARPDDRVLDVIYADPGQWVLGHHVAGTTSQRWPGGVPRFAAPPELISRAWKKTAEALLWSGIPVSRGDLCVEIGAAPGGSCQRLLELGARVLAVDPADLDPRIADHPDVTHLKMRGRDLPHRRLSEAKWLLVDTTIAPDRALQMSEALATSRHTHFRGLLLTLKMLDDQRVADIPQYIQAVKSWGFRFVKTRHLAYGRREICLAALKQKSVRRFRK